MEVLKINDNSIKVKSEGSITVVAKYEDENGIFFFDENLEKQYAESSVKAWVKFIDEKGRLDQKIEVTEVIHGEDMKKVYQRLTKKYKQMKIIEVDYI